MVPEVGLEPTTHNFSGCCSTLLELLWHKMASLEGIEPCFCNVKGYRPSQVDDRDIMVDLRWIRTPRISANRVSTNILP